MKKFDAYFKEKTSNKYPYIRFIRAEYSRSGNLLTVFFLVQAEAMNNNLLTDDVKKDILTSISDAFPSDMLFSVKYVKSGATIDTVRARLMQILNAAIPVAIDSLSDDDIRVEVNDYVIDVKIFANESVCALLSVAEKQLEIIDKMNEFFVENVNFEVSQKYISESEIAKIAEKNKQIIKNSDISGNITVDEKGNIIDKSEGIYSDLIATFDEKVELYAQSRLVKVNQLKNLVGKMYLNTRPIYIIDITENLEKVTVCGTVTGLVKRRYNNKYFGKKQEELEGRKNVNTTDETLPWYSFVLDDTTAKINVVYFTKFQPPYEFEQSFTEGAHVAISGKVSQNHGEMQIIVDKMWQVEIDYSTIVLERPGKKEAKKYQLIQPEKYFEESQCGMEELLSGNTDVAPYLKGKTFVVFDLETTGLDTKKCKIVQLGSYKIVDGRIVETFCTLVNPECHIPEETTAIHNVCDADVVNAPTFKEIVGDFYKFTRGATLVGHNSIGYDYPILSRMGSEEGYNFDNAVLDTWSLSKSQFNFSSYNLKNIAKELNLGLEHAHRADFDAIATAKLFIILAQKLK